MKGWLRARRRPAVGRRALITEPSGRLAPGSAATTFVVAVGRGFNQSVPNAMTLILLGYCRAFESLGIPYRIADMTDLEDTLVDLPSPFCLVNGHDLGHPSTSKRAARALRGHPSCVWATPWVRDSDRFFASNVRAAGDW